jgi:hypothetical protein
MFVIVFAATFAGGFGLQYLAFSPDVKIAQSKSTFLRAGVTNN